jgi:glycosyltransferase involved in cell wall biosynthesis
MGRSIVTSDAPGCREPVIDGYNGYLITVGDIQGVVDKMKHLISNPNLCKKMGETSQGIARDKYDVNKVNQAILQTMGLI